MQERDRLSGQSVTLHATTVDYGGKGVLIAGASGAGKSALALDLMALGATLVADDRTIVTCTDENYIASAPKAIEGMIEARGVGLLLAERTERSALVLAIDLDRTETERLPPPRRFERGFVSLTCLNKVDAPYFPAAILQYLKVGRREGR